MCTRALSHSSEPNARRLEGPRRLEGGHIFVEAIHVRLMRFFYLGLSFESYGPTLVDAIYCRNIDESRRMAAEHVRKAIERSASLLMGAIRFGEMVFEATPEKDNSRLKFGPVDRRV
jgi:hypothetical protein